MRRWVLLLAGLAWAPEAHAVVWTYDHERIGQEDWSNLAPEFEKCNKGANQSPVTISKTTIAKLPALSFGYTTGNAQLSLDRYTIVATSKQPQTVKEGDATYTLKELLVRTPSEHEIGDAFYMMELQLVHERADKTPVIVSVFVKEGAANPAIQTLIDHFPKRIREPQTTTIDWAALIPKQLGRYAYTGSISYPPCTEGAEIRVLKTPIEATKTQIEQLVKRLGRNSRLAQPLFLRIITESED